MAIRRTVRLTGFVAWVFWSVAHIYYLIGARERLIGVALDWLSDYLTYQRGARLINEPLKTIVSAALGPPCVAPLHRRIHHITAPAKTTMLVLMTGTTGTRVL